MSNVIALFILALPFLLFSCVRADAAQDTMPPQRMNLLPRGPLFGGERNVALSLRTDESAECRYGRAGGEPYAKLESVFATTSGTSGATDHRALERGLSIGASYMFAVRCVDGSGNANTDDVYIAFSVTAPVDGGDFTKPAAPPDVRLSIVSETETALSWAASYDNDAVAKYRIFRCESGYCTPKDLVATPTTTAYRDANLRERTHYRYQVTAIDVSGNESPRSRIAAATTTLSAAVAEAPESMSVAEPGSARPATPRTALATTSAPRTPEERANLLLRQIQALIRHLTRLLAQYGALIQNGK